MKTPQEVFEEIRAARRHRFDIWFDKLLWLFAIGIIVWIVFACGDDGDYLTFEKCHALNLKVTEGYDGHLQCGGLNYGN